MTAIVAAMAGAMNSRYFRRRPYEDPVRAARPGLARLNGAATPLRLAGDSRTECVPLDVRTGGRRSHRKWPRHPATTHRPPAASRLEAALEDRLELLGRLFEL